jgi:alpha-1,2-mannosyltransferase
MTTLVQSPASVSEKVYAVFTGLAAAILFHIVGLDFKLAAAQSFPTFVLDPVGFPVGRDFLNTWMGGRSAFSGGPAAWFDSDVTWLRC